MSRIRALLLAALLLAPLALAAPTPGADWRGLVLIDSERAEPDMRFEAFDAASLNLFDFDGDGWPEVVSANDNNRVYVLDAREGKALAEIQTTHPDPWEARMINPVAIGDLYGDGVPCLVIPNSAAYLSAWCYDGQSFTGRMKFERRWEVHVDAAEHEADFREKHPWIYSDGDPTNDMPGLDGNVYLADVDAAPGLEVFVETDGYPGQLSFTHEGEYRWSTSHWDGNAGVVVHDLQGDGTKEAVFASDAGIIACYDADSGKLRWSFDARKHGASPGSVTLAPLVADLDGDGASELVFAARGAVDGADWEARSHATWFALRADGSVLWKRSEAWMNPLVYNHPAALDVDGDGDLDVVALDWNTIGHKPGNWEPTQRGAQLFALDGRTGAPMWHVSVASYWSNKDFVVAELDGRPGLEIIVNEAREGRDGLGIRALSDGRSVGWWALPEGWEAMRGPVAADADGRLLLVVPLARPDPTPNYRTLDVGHREGAIVAIDARVAPEIAWSANILHSDDAGDPQLSTLAAIPSPWWVLVAALGAAAVVSRRARR